MESILYKLLMVCFMLSYVYSYTDINWRKILLVCVSSSDMKYILVNTICSARRLMYLIIFLFRKLSSMLKQLRKGSSTLMKLTR